jgi:hypothetical protein
MALLFFREVITMDPQATEGPSQRQVPAEPERDGARRTLAAPAAGAPAPSRRQDATLSQDGQILEAGYGHGV